MSDPLNEILGPTATSSPRVGDRVRLKSGVAELNLRRGDRGCICSIWFVTTFPYYEVEFESGQSIERPRALLAGNQIEFDSDLPES